MTKGLRKQKVLVDRPLVDTGRDVDWTQALCRGIEEPDRFHVDHIAKLQKVTDAAIEQCNRPCPIRDECLEYALVNDIRHGVYGGKTSRERNKILKERNAA